MEFVNRESINSLLATTKIPDDEDTCVVPFKSRFIKIKSHELDQNFVSCSPHASVSPPQLLKKLCAAKNVSS